MSVGLSVCIPVCWHFCFFPTV